MAEMREEPNTKFYFDRKIARVVFADDEKRKVYWFDTSGIRLRLLHLYHNLFYQANQHLRLPIEEWLKENNMNYVEDDMVLFELTWL